MNLTLYGRPITKKNSSRIVMAGRFPKLLPSKQFVDYQNDCLKQLTGAHRINLKGSYNVKCSYYMPTRHKVDLTNLLNATMDILVEAKVLKDDNSNIVVGHDGSRVYYDKENPRVEIEIQEVEK